MASVKSMNIKIVSTPIPSFVFQYSIFKVQEFSFEKFIGFVDELKEFNVEVTQVGNRVRLFVSFIGFEFEWTKCFVNLYHTPKGEKSVEFQEWESSDKSVFLSFVRRVKPFFVAPPFRVPEIDNPISITEELFDVIGVVGTLESNIANTYQLAKFTKDSCEFLATKIPELLKFFDKDHQSEAINRNLCYIIKELIDFDVRTIKTLRKENIDTVIRDMSQQNTYIKTTLEYISNTYSLYYD